MIDWLWNGVIGFILGAIPTWAWVVLAGLIIGWAWKTFGTQGVVGALVAILTLGAYRQGWRDRDGGKAPSVPTGPIRLPTASAQPPAPRKKRRTLMDIINGN